MKVDGQSTLGACQKLCKRRHHRHNNRRHHHHHHYHHRVYSQRSHTFCVFYTQRSCVYVALPWRRPTERWRQHWAWRMATRRSNAVNICLSLIIFVIISHFLTIFMLIFTGKKWTGIRKRNKLITQSQISVSLSSYDHSLPVHCRIS